jgi:hypothetical protein
LIYIMWLECTLGILNNPTYTLLILFGKTSVIEFRNPNFFRCGYVHMAASWMWLDIRISFGRS